MNKSLNLLFEATKELTEFNNKLCDSFEKLKDYELEDLEDVELGMYIDKLHDKILYLISKQEKLKNYKDDHSPYLSDTSGDLTFRYAYGEMTKEQCYNKLVKEVRKRINKKRKTKKNTIRDKIR